ncbi:protein prenylyltransferase [Piromyces finnis]|uniref:ER membrane protein complex subunit 2 n=1 Tax=Piromyces finnis TaxID=1754191 RepID=A0A1Y1VBQ3_9FUNG|nr:protein prenylyltransferase [Piromyces finnis]|eukprot:ORX52187.1 protein prenylyltransferase [Piromyces finnis]
MDVIELAKPLIDNKFSSLDSVEKYEILEQLIIAYLDINDVLKAEKYLSIITKKIDNGYSSRLQKLNGMIEETKGNYEKAIDIYNETLKKDELNEAVHKRLIAVNIANGNRDEAIKLLNKYLEIFVSGDEDAWLQLADLYLLDNQCQQAAYCIEEVILIDPRNHLYYLRYADIMLCLGKYQMASKYYCKALDLCKDNVRALYGILYSNQYLLKSKPEDKLTSNETIQSLINLAKEELEKLYKSSPCKEVVKEFLEQ